jgi:hypothetical protein
VVKVVLNKKLLDRIAAIVWEQTLHHAFLRLIQLNSTDRTLAEDQTECAD